MYFNDNNNYGVVESEEEMRIKIFLENQDYGGHKNLLWCGHKFH